MKKWLPIVGLALLWAAICYKTYIGGTYLLGWDNLVPEFGFGTNIVRALSTAWQDYQGVGLLGGMGHAADLTRQIILWIASFVLSTSVLRWGWTLLMLLVGSLGVYALGGLLFESSLVALVGALFYFLNPVTIQVFNVPFETFTSFYGFIPWMIWGSLLYLKRGRSVDLLKILVIFLLGMSAFVVQTMFIVFVIMLGIISAEYLIRHRDVLRIFKLWEVVVSVNMFWLLPVVWFGITSSSVNVNAKMNLLATEEVELMNVAYGNAGDVTRLNGWWLQNTDVGIDGKIILLMQNWTEWLGNRTVGFVGLAVAVLAGVGLLAMIRKDLKKNLIWSWIIILLLILTMLARRVEVFAQTYNYISQNVPLFGQMFRASYTKWSIPLILVMSVGLMSLMGLFNKRFTIIVWMMGLVIVGMATYTVMPVFNDGIVGVRMKARLPSEYLNLFEYFRGAEMGRIAKLPANFLWGWNYNDWGYRGSGFLWYGIAQPILDRAFDVWSPYNEGFYNQISTALYGCESDQSQITNSQILKLECEEQVRKVLQKYDVRYVLLDESVIAPGQDKNILRIEETKRIAEELGWEQKFKEGFLTVWELPGRSDLVGVNPTRSDLGVIAPESYTLAEGETVKARDDVIFEDNGSYVSGMGGAQYPFANLMREEVPTVSKARAGEGRVEWGEGGVTLRSDLVGFEYDLQPTRSDLGEQELVVPGWEVGEIVRVDFASSSATTLGTRWEPLPAYYVNDQPGPVFLGDEKPADGKSYFYLRVSEGEEWQEYRVGSRFKVQGKSLNIEVKGEPFVYHFAKQGQGSIGNCDVLKRGNAEKIINPKFSNSQIGGQGTAYVADERGAVCDYVVMEAPFTRVPHLLRLRGENTEGRSIKFFLYNTGSKRNDIEYLLGKGKFDQTFALLPWAWDGYYTLNIETRSFGQRAENRIEPVVGMYVPLEKIARARINTAEQLHNNLEVTYVKKTGTWLYGLGVKGHGLIRLSQGYDEGWVGLVVPQSHSDKVTQLQHVKVDGWANGWLLNQDDADTLGNQIVIIIYWPQLLQYLGLVMLGITVLALISAKRH